MEQGIITTTNQEKIPDIKVESIKGPEGNEVSFVKDRGGIITSLKIDGVELLYMDEATLRNPEVNIKGGIPVLFPNAGPLSENTLYPNMKQHGFARDLKWDSVVLSDSFKMTLSKHQDSYPHDYNLSQEGSFEKDGSFTLKQIIQNLDKENPMPVSMGLHPYFKVANIDKSNIKFNFQGGEIIKNEIDKWTNGKAVSIDNPNTKMEISIPHVGTLCIEASPLYKKIWVWSMTDKDFICVEPVMRDKNGLLDDPELVQPNSNHHMQVNFSFKRE